MAKTVTMSIQDDTIPHVLIAGAQPDPLNPSPPPSLLPQNTSTAVIDSIEWRNNLTSKTVSVHIPWAQHVFQGGGANKQFDITPGGSRTLNVLVNPRAGYRGKRHKYTIYVMDDGPYVIAASDPEIEIK